MTQVKLDRKPYAKHTFYKGTYYWQSQAFTFELTEEWSINGTSTTQVEFDDDMHEIPFNIDMATKQILNLYLPQDENKN